jgi:cytochrome c
MKMAFYLLCGLAIITGAIVLLANNQKTGSGRQIFQQQCAVCHNADSSDRKMGPGLKGLYQLENLASNGKRVTDASVRAKIDEGGNGMPSFERLLSDKDKSDVIAYLKTL